MKKESAFIMRKQTKLVAVLSAAALFAIGASMTSFAGTAHWEQEGEDWVYLDKDGDKVTDTWKKSGSNWFYLDSDGYMAKDTIVISGSDDDKYYVDANGAKVTNTWVSVDNSDDNECADQEDVSTIWYFFGSNGEAKRGEDGKKVFTNIPYGQNMDKKGTFAFDEDGHMLSGWQDITLTNGTYRYYFGDENEGWAYLGWQYLEKPEDDDFDEANPFEDEAWFWFGSNGRAARNATKHINGQYYTFDETGAMDDKWVQGTPGISKPTAQIASDADAFYTDSIGHRRTGWIYAYDPDDADEEGDQYWFYLNNKGEAFNDRAKDTKKFDSKGNEIADYDATASKVLDPTSQADDVAAKVIKNKTYLFDENGRMVTGLRNVDAAVLREGGKDLAAGIYYFSTEDGSGEGQMMTGKQTIDDEGDKYTYYFQKNGQAYKNRLVKGSIYGADGLRLEAEDGSKYELVVVENDILDEAGKKVVIPANTTVIVNASGTVKKSASTVDVDGVKYSVKNYVATEKADQD
ncbi:MAG: hypothetical protein ACOX8K_05295 [Lachnospiraceae bacterium]